jgi:DNA-binding MarR family transcriptional regulator
VSKEKASEQNRLLSEIEKQNDVIISLLGRMAFTPEKIADIVTKKKHNPEKYIKGYNACDGNHQVTELANIVGVKQPTLTPILQEWEDMGIVFEVEKPNGTFYKKLYPLVVKKQEGGAPII